jgi:hypothetical protein
MVAREAELAHAPDKPFPYALRKRHVTLPGCRIAVGRMRRQAVPGDARRSGCALSAALRRPFMVAGAPNAASHGAADCDGHPEGPGSSSGAARTAPSRHVTARSGGSRR